MKPFFLLLTLILGSIKPHTLISINLEEKTNPCILELKQIHIEDHPHAFNPSIVKWNNSLYICFREIVESDYWFQSKIGIVQLDEELNPIGRVQFLDCGIETNGIEDARLISINEHLYLVYSAGCKELPAVHTNGSGDNCRMYIAELELGEYGFIVIDNECISRFEDENPFKTEKNWVPFDYKGNLLLSYSIFPHRVYRPIFGTQACESLSLTTGRIYWPWGELRGGTQGILEGNYYISFFHSSIPIQTNHSDEQIIPHYFMGAYTYSSEPPFEITSISSEPIIGEGFYTGKIHTPYWHPVRVIFPYGLIGDKNYLWVSYGRQDHEMWIAKFDKYKLLQSLIPVRA